MNVIECNVCTLPFSHTVAVRTPRILTACGHTICEGCAQRLTWGNHLQIRCPVDRIVTKLNDAGVKGLPKNFALLDTVYETRETKETQAATKKSDNPCAENQSHEALLYCLQCDVDLCKVCFDKIHKSNALAGHKSVPISEKPIKLPKCPKHPYNTAEFLCTQTDCTNPNKVMCHTCMLTTEHKTHDNELLMDRVLRTEELLKKSAKLLEQHEKKVEQCLAKSVENIGSFDPEGTNFKNMEKMITDVFEEKKMEALEELMRWSMTAIQNRLEKQKRLTKDLNTVKKLSGEITNKLTLKNDMQGTEDSTKTATKATELVRDWKEPTGPMSDFNDFAFLVPEITLVIEPKSENNNGDISNPLPVPRHQSSH